MNAEQTRLDVTSNNIANVGTPGFKKVRADFEDVMYQVLQEPGAPTSAFTRSPTGTEIGMGVRAAGTTRMHTEGELKQTGNALDLAIEGPGFLQVKLPSGETAYTRAGNLKLDSDGKIVTSDGFGLTNEITISPDAQAITIAADGTVSATMPNEAAPVEAGKLQLATFANPAGLRAEGHNLFKETAASGTPIVGAPGENGTGTLTQGSLEMSNVQIVEEMIDLIAGQRAYEVNSRVVQAADQMLQDTAQLR
jgi:flagellar basal-body rod protein FlgG